MSPAPKAASKPAAKKSPVVVADLTPDQVDAVLRDPHVPGDVRAQVADHYNAQRYLASVEFTVDGDGVTHVTRPEA